MSLTFSKKTLIAIFSILALSLYTYVPGYSYPSDLFWDENFHIASAQRYLNGVFFLEPHPPLGKLFIAAGEWLFGFNQSNDQFVGIEKAAEIPEGFSFAGYRLLPVLCAVLIPPLVFLVVLQLTGSLFAALCSGMLPALDNAMIVHARGAMLEPPQLFFVLLAILSYLKARRDEGAWWPILLGVSCAAALLIKINSIAVLLFPIALLLEEKRFLRWGLRIVLPAICTYLLIWQVHFLFARTIEPSLDGKGLFGVSSEYEIVVRSGRGWMPTHLFEGIREWFQFSKRYQQGVPELDYCKEDENGSDPLIWPLGGRAINYRWEDAEHGTKYLYLTPNPVVWSLGLIGALGTGLVLLVRVCRVHCSSSNQTQALLFFVYLCSWLPALIPARVFYLYHYFLPLTISWILFGIILSRISQRYQLKILWAVALSSVVSYVWFSPFTYYKPLTDKGVAQRAWISLWDIRCKDCPSSFHESCQTSGNVASRTSPEWSLKLNSVEANFIEQSAGTPLQSENTFEILTNSKIQFPINKRFAYFDGEVSLAPDSVNVPVEFKVITDGMVVWSTVLTKDSKQKENFSVRITDSAVLTLKARSSGSKTSSPVLWKKLFLR